MPTPVEERVRELKSRWNALDAETTLAIDTAPVVDGVLTIDNTRRATIQRNTAEMKSLQDTMDTLTGAYEAKAWGNATPQSVALGAGAGAGPQWEQKSLGQMFTDSAEFKSFADSGMLTMPAAFDVTGVDMGAQIKWVPGNPEQKDVYTGLPTGAITQGFRTVQREDMVARSFRKLRVRDLFPVQNTTSGLIEYFRITGFTGSGNASVVPERAAGAFGLKPQTPLTFVGVQAPIRTIAHWEAVHRNILMDVPQLQGVVNNELLYGLRLAEDFQILNGTGTGEDMLGILNTPGIQTYSRPGTGTDNKADDIRRAATKVILAYYEPTGVVMHPSDWESIELLKDSTGAYIVAVAVAMGGQQRLWRLPVVDTPAMTQGTALVGAFGLGATFYDREEGNIRISESHSDFFVRNAIVVLAEERCTITVKRPETFVKVTLGA
jgi:HK97 family phage major capsid protein